jgi:DNA-binding transcriptional ArsR family regulator
MAKKEISISKMQESCIDTAQLLRALSHPQRLLVLGLLSLGEKSVSELQAICEISQSQLSQFLNRMKAEGLINCERRGKFQYYFIADIRIKNLILALYKIFCK